MSRFATKCETCKLHYQGFHICIDLSTPEPALPVLRSRPATRTGQIDDTTNMSLAAQERWERVRLENRKRDEAVVEFYAQGGVGYNDIREKFGIGQSTIQKILYRAQAEGRVKIRGRGGNIKYGF